MRTTEERVAAVQTRVIQLKKRDRMIRTTAVAAMLVLVLSVAGFSGFAGGLSDGVNRGNAMEEIADASVPLAGFLSAPEDVALENGTLRWSPVDGADYYTITIGDETWVVDESELSLDVGEVSSGKEITIVAGANGQSGAEAKYLVP